MVLLGTRPVPPDHMMMGSPLGLAPAVLNDPVAQQVAQHVTPDVEQQVRLDWPDLVADFPAPLRWLANRMQGRILQALPRWLACGVTALLRSYGGLTVRDIAQKVL